MIFKINKQGHLEIKRKNKFKVVECKGCIYAVLTECGHAYVCGETTKIDYAAYHYKPCGDWCSLFGEPEVYKDSDTGEEKICLGLCNSNYLTCDVKDFVDERED